MWKWQHQTSPVTSKAVLSALSRCTRTLFFTRTHTSHTHICPLPHNAQSAVCHCRLSTWMQRATGGSSITIHLDSLVYLFHFLYAEPFFLRWGGGPCCDHLSPWQPLPGSFPSTWAQNDGQKRVMPSGKKRLSVWAHCVNLRLGREVVGRAKCVWWCEWGSSHL